MIAWAAHRDYWNLYHDVTFDGVERIITINEGVTEINVKESIYSAWKEWMMVDDYAKYLPAIRTVGGDPISNELALGDTYFLINGWRIRPWEGHYRLNVYGNLYTEEGDSPYLSTINPANILINSTVSNLIQTVTAGSTCASGGGLTDEQHTKLMSIPSTTLEADERAHLMGLSNIDMQTFVDAVWNKQLPGTSITVAEYILKKLLTTNKFIGLQEC